MFRVPFSLFSPVTSSGVEQEGVGDDGAYRLVSESGRPTRAWMVGVCLFDCLCLK